MYILNYIDRNAVPHARVQGLEKDLGMSGYKYNIVLSVTFIGCIAMQVPSNMILTKVRPSWYLSGCMATWGIVSGLSGAVHSFAGLAVNRFFLGITEGAFGVLFAAGIAAAFSNNSLESRRWLFIMEGIATVVFATAAASTIPDWPATTKWLTPEEKAIGVWRIIEDAGKEEEEISTSAAFKLAAGDYHIWLCVIGQMCLQAVASLTSFLPTLVQSFGYGTVETLLLTSPPYIFTTLFCLLNTWYSDPGTIITIATANTGARYFALFLMLPGTYGCFQISNAWMANIAARPQKKRAIALTANNSIGNLALVWIPESCPPRHCNHKYCGTGALLKRKNRHMDNSRNFNALEQGVVDGKNSSTHVEERQDGPGLEQQVVGTSMRY
ncbi:major facilitator superfamily transporter [Colletotrichum salicis]|uniref:Major facilitator superfamily transporter n=1 Tax=Colletotrichum salicis TaxID=1209931 RepID=A0A135RMX6_9PEZI|nr:major facilitator superfamily transporter [Colletotrichum salicis]